MTGRTVQQAIYETTCDRCGFVTRDEGREGWLSVSGTFHASGHENGGDQFMGDFCPRCLVVVGAVLFPISNRNRAMVGDPWRHMHRVSSADEDRDDTAPIGPDESGS